MSPEFSKPKEEEKNIINIYTTNKAVIENLYNGGGKDLSQITLISGIGAHIKLEESLSKGIEPQRLIQVTLKKAKDQTLRELGPKEFYTCKSVFKYHRGEIGGKIEKPNLFDHLFPVVKNLQEIIEKDQQGLNEYYTLNNKLKEKIDKIKDIHRKITIKGFIKVEILRYAEVSY